ncbi:MAG: hypothetical protein JWN93_49, partial [Hyphomicrobiales bacterium]|nr:hypothetical protein [Hyphomicrobiales bacterium]
PAGVPLAAAPAAPAAPQYAMGGSAGASSFSYSGGGSANTVVSGPVVYAGAGGSGAAGYYPEPCVSPQVIRIETFGRGAVAYNRPSDLYVEAAPACGAPQMVRQVFYADPPAPPPLRALPPLRAKY